MAIECVAPVMEARLGPWRKGDLMVLLMLANYAWPDGTNIFPSVPTLARACRLSPRQVQESLQALLDDGVLILVQEANKPGFGGRRTNEYRLDMERVQKMQGCKICGGGRCQDRGCSEAPHPRRKQRGTGANSAPDPRRKPRAYIDRPVKDPLLTKRGLASRAPERRGDPALWEKLSASLPPSELLRLQSFEAEPKIDGGRVIVDFPKGFMEGHVRGLQRDLKRAFGTETVMRFAGREAQP